MTITKTFTIDIEEEINRIIERLESDCYDSASDMLLDIPITTEEYWVYRDKLKKELFEGVVTKLISDKKEAE